MAIDDNTSYELTGYQVKDLAGRIRLKADASAIPTVNDATLTLVQNGTTVGTFTANQSTNTTVNLAGGIYADDPTAPANPNAWITSSDIDWSTIRKTLYTGPSGSSGSFQLNETAANFDALIIKYRRGTNGNTTKTDTIWDPDGTSYQLLTSAADNSVFTFYGGRIGISGTTVTWQAGSAVAFNNGGQAGFGASNELVILSVVGIKLG